MQVNKGQNYPLRMHNSHLPQHIWYTSNPTTIVLTAFQKQESGVCILSWQLIYM